MRAKVILCALYLAAVVAANLVIAEYGKAAVLYVGFAFVAFAFVARDRLHDAFGDHRFLKIGALIVAGSVLSYALNADAEKVAVASAVAFFAGEASDTAAYHLLRVRPWLERSNGSNIVGAVVDTVVFMLILFGSIPTELAFAQACCKIAGGFILSLALRRRRTAAFA